MWDFMRADIITREGSGKHESVNSHFSPPSHSLSLSGIPTTVPVLVFFHDCVSTLQPPMTLHHPVLLAMPYLTKLGRPWTRILLTLPSRLDSVLTAEDGVSTPASALPLLYLCSASALPLLYLCSASALPLLYSGRRRAAKMVDADGTAERLHSS